MNIKEQIRLSVLISLIIVIVISGSVVYISLVEKDLQYQENLAAEVVRGGYELSQLSHQYFFTGELRPLIQWQERYDSLQPIISKLKPTNAQEERSISIIRQSNIQLGQIIEEFPKPDESEPTPLILSAVFPMVTWNRNQVQTQGLIFESWELRQLYNADLLDIGFLNEIFILILIIAMFIIISVNYLLLSRRLVLSIQEINAGTEAFTDGNFSYRIPVTKDDEIGGIARGLNTMAEEIKNVTASRDELNREIAERRQAEEELRESEVRFRTMSDWTQDWEYWLTHNREVVYCSPSIESITGYSVDEFMSDKNLIDRMIHPDDRALWEEHTPIHTERGDQKNENPTEIEFRIITKDGKTRWISHICRAIYADDGTWAGRRISNRDITKRKKAEDALRTVNKKLNLLSSITRHDIINQVTGAEMFVELMEMEGEIPQDSKGAEDLKKVADALKTIERQIVFTRDYQDLGVQSPGWQKVGLIIDQTAPTGIQGLTLLNEVGDLEIYADPLFEKVVYNLFDNAVRHGEKITTIRFYSEETPEGFKVVCEDDGIGIPADVKEKIFNRQYFKHTGLGLFLSREIVSITGMTISETGVPGEGARFEILVPEGMWRSG